MVGLQTSYNRRILVRSGISISIFQAEKMCFPQTMKSMSEVGCDVVVSR